MELNSMSRASLEFFNTFWKFHFQSPKSIVPLTHSSCWAKLNLHTTTLPKKTKTRFDDLWSLLKQLFWHTAVSLIIERAHLSAALPGPLLFYFFARLLSNTTHFPRPSHGERLLPLPHRYSASSLLSSLGISTWLGTWSPADDLAIITKDTSTTATIGSLISQSERRSVRSS